MEDNPSKLLELAWAAGLFDGEGSSIVSPKGYAELSIGQAGSPEVLERFRNAVGLGKIYGPYQRPDPNHQDKWEYDVRSHDAFAVMELIYPLLSSIKQRQWDSVESRARKARRPGFCNKDTHELTGDNVMADGRCRPCRHSSNRARDYRTKNGRNPL